MTSKFSLFPNYKDFGYFKHFCLEVESQSLKGNPLGDESLRYNQGLLPKKEGDYTVVLVLSGFTSNGSKNFNFKSFETDFVTELDLWTKKETIKPNIYLFVDAWTLYGGSQFINSPGCGNYEDYIVKDLVVALKEKLPSGYNVKNLALMGGSSGGYGTLHLASKYPKLFTQALSIAPDADFDLSLKQELFHALYHVEEYGGLEESYKSIKTGEINIKKRSFHQMINALAMAACYSEIDANGFPKFPVNKEGEIDQNLWSSWLEKDPLFFLRERVDNLKSLKTLFLTVGSSDQFLLQYGSRKLHHMFNSLGIEHVYEEFRGNHFDLGKQRKKALSLL